MPIDKITNPFYLGSFTTAERDLLTESSGAMIWNSDKNKIESYNGTTWDTSVVAQSKSYSFSSQGAAAASYFRGGFYEFPATSVTLTQASLTQTYGTANVSYAAHPFVVVSDAGISDTGSVVGLKVTGTRIEDDGTRTASYSYDLSTDITTLSANDFLEAPKFIGQVTFELYEISGTPTNYSISFNYGLAKYEDFGNYDFILNGIETVGYAGANDTGFNIELLHHKQTGWTYSATSFTHPTSIYSLSTDHSTESDLSNGEYFAWKRSGLTDLISGSTNEGIILKITTGAANAVQIMDTHITVLI